MLVPPAVGSTDPAVTIDFKGYCSPVNQKVEVSRMKATGFGKSIIMGIMILSVGAFIA